MLGSSSNSYYFKMNPRSSLFHFSVISMLLLISSLSSSRILGIFPVNSNNHDTVIQPIMKNLVARGHQVTVITHFECESRMENYTEIKWSECQIFPFVNEEEGSLSVTVRRSNIERSACTCLFQMNYIRKLLSFGEKTDLIVADVQHSLCFHLLAEYLNIPMVIITPTAFNLGVDIMLGNPHNPSYLPSMFSSTVITNIDFWSRFWNNLSYVVLYVSHYSFFNYYMPGVARLHFDMQLPSAMILHKRTALVLNNNHFSIIPRPYVPNIIDIAGIHIKDPEPLNYCIQDFIDRAEHGAIFVSLEFESNKKSMSNYNFAFLLKGFTDIPQRILWQMDTSLDNKLSESRNVKIQKRFPQRDILEHPNIRVFISNCETLNILEALHTGTPIICIPLFDNQRINSRGLERKKVAIVIEQEDLTEDSLSRSLKEIFNNSEYSENMRTLSNIFKDRPMKPMDSAIFWIEYILRHGGAPHMRISGADIPFYEYFSLDILVVLFIFISIPSGMIIYHLVYAIWTEISEIFICCLELLELNAVRLF